MTYDSPFAAIGNTRDTQEVEAKVGAIVHSFAPGHDLSRIARTFSLLDRAFDAAKRAGNERFFKTIHG